MREVTNIVRQAGLIDDSTLHELSRWAAPSVPPMGMQEDAEPIDPARVPALIDEAMQSQEQVLSRETDLEVLHQYESTQREGRLRLETLAGEVAYADITYGKTPLGCYIIPWASESVKDVLADCAVSLEEDGSTVQLASPRELYYGSTKAFTVWERAA
jgi:hypothetical protein